jgi:hypothetical protein
MTDSSVQSKGRVYLFAIIIIVELLSVGWVIDQIFATIKPFASSSPTLIQNVTEQTYYFNQSILNDGFSVLIIFMILIFLYFIDKRIFEFLSSIK